MNDSQAQSSFSQLPPPPPRAGSGRGCLRMALIGCGALLALGIIAVVVSALWWNRNGDELTSRGSAAAREGARFGMVRDEAACFQAAVRRTGTDATLADNFAAGAFARACLEYSRPTAGFCDGVPPATSIRRAAEWQQQRCGTDAACRNVSQVVAQYCHAGRPKRPASDTLLMGAGAAAADPGGAAPADSGTF